LRPGLVAMAIMNQAYCPLYFDNKLVEALASTLQLKAAP
jgi:hypothetical protein